YTTGDRYSNGEIEQPTQKETWIPDTQSGILQVRRCTSNLNSRTNITAFYCVISHDDSSAFPYLTAGLEIISIRD
ncbi:MAG: hypothetical protein WBQ69_01760, partial [Gallionella sp.]